MTRWLAIWAVCLWTGTAVLLAPLRWFRSPPLVARLAPYRSTRIATPTRSGVLSAQSLRDIVGPVTATFGNRLSKMLGVSGELATRLERVDSSYDANGFRLRQAAWSAIALSVTTAIALVTEPPVPVTTLLLIGGPLLTFLLIEHRVVSASAQWQRRMLLELPVVIEQLGMLLSSGYSLGSAIARLGQRGRGICAGGLREVTSRVRQGVSEIDALREWASVADVAAFDRVVAVLAMNWEAGDLGALISNEAKAVRREVQRAEIEIIERRGQQVWIPVTVATLLPGVIFMSIPFIDAVSKLTGR